MLLTVSNVVMAFAWYGHLRHKGPPLLTAIPASWGSAFFEYCSQVPANRSGHSHFSAAQLKTVQEVVSLLVIGVFPVLYLREGLRWNHLVGFAPIVAAVFVAFHER